MFRSDRLPFEPRAVGGWTSRKLHTWCTVHQSGSRNRPLKGCRGSHQQKPPTLMCITPDPVPRLVVWSGVGLKFDPDRPKTAMCRRTSEVADRRDAQSFGGRDDQQSEFHSMHKSMIKLRSCRKILKESNIRTAHDTRRLITRKRTFTLPSNPS